MTDVLGMATLQVSNPVTRLVLMEINNPAFQKWNSFLTKLQERILPLGENYRS